MRSKSSNSWRDWRKTTWNRLLCHSLKTYRMILISILIGSVKSSVVRMKLKNRSLLPVKDILTKIWKTLKPNLLLLLSSQLQTSIKSLDEVGTVIGSKYLNINSSHNRRETNLTWWLRIHQSRSFHLSISKTEMESNNWQKSKTLTLHHILRTWQCNHLSRLPSQ
jgi:hypothetical protein